jgi:hypothetical protein
MAGGKNRLMQLLEPGGGFKKETAVEIAMPDSHANGIEK